MNYRCAVAPSVLIVEDDRDTREALREILESEGFPVLEAEHGQQALARLEDVRPGVILLDLIMPVMNGWELYAALKSSSAHQSIPVVVTSAHERHGLNEVRSLAKPFTLKELLAAVRGAMRT
jgi:CheY-like chemotaxis protein